MGSTAHIWVKAARLRTLPLSLSGIIIGNGIAFLQGNFSLLICSFAILTTVSFQVLSNFANDYGDGVKGTDNFNRIGPARVLQQGLLTPTALKKGIVVTTLISVILTFSLIAFSFSSNEWIEITLFLALGIASIIAAIKYTVGTSAYGYMALGDLFVFLFFGLLSVLGSYYLQTKQIEMRLLLPAISIGCLSTAVLNLNNMRDLVNDKENNKTTIAVILGFTKAKYYHFGLLLTAIFSVVYFMSKEANTFWGFVFVPVLSPLFLHAIRILRTSENKELDSELKPVALTTFFLSFFVIISLYIDRL